MRFHAVESHGMEWGYSTSKLWHHASVPQRRRQMKTPVPKATDSIPPAESVRAIISERLAEVQLLRGLLKLAERKERLQPGRRRKVARA